MAGLTDTTIAASYDQLLIVDNDGGGNSTTHVAVKDGDGGTTFPITLATDAIMITSTNRLEFGDNASYIHQSADGVLDLVSDTEIEINATSIDINGKVIMSVDSATDNVIIESVDGGAATAPDLVLYRNSASPADNDYIGQLLYRGRNDNSQDVSYVEISGVIIDASDGTEDSALYMFTMANGSQVNTMTLDRGNVGIGNASPASALTVKGGSSEYVNIGTVTESTSGRKSLNIMYDSSDNVSKIQSHHQGSAYTALCLQPNGGDVGIGVSSPNIGGWNVNYNVLTIKGDTTNYGGVLELANPDSTGNYFGSVSFLNLDGGSDVVAQARFSATRDGADDASAFVFETEPTGGAVAERMRIDSAGTAMFGTTTRTATGVGGASFDPNSVGRCLLLLGSVNYTSSVDVARFYNDNGEVGDIRTDGSGASFNSNSDYRLKENEVVLSNALIRLNNHIEDLDHSICPPLKVIIFTKIKNSIF